MKWLEVRVSDYCLLAIDCVNKTAPVVETETPYRMIRTSDIAKGRVDLTNLRYVTEETFEKWTRRAKPQIGDVILSREAPIGNVGRITTSDNLFLGQRLFMYRTDPSKLDSRFLSSMFQTQEVQGRILSKGFGVTVQHIKVGDAENLVIPIPPLSVQKRIADILSAYDDLIEVNRRSIQLLEESARRLYKEWFVHFRFPNHEKTTMVNGLPEGWKRGTAFDIADVLSGGTPKTEMAEYWDGEIPFYTPKDALDSSYVFQSEKTLTEMGLKNCNSRLYPKDTVFITARGTVGKLNLAMVPMAMNQSCYALKSKAPFNQELLFYTMKMCVESFKSQSGGAVFNAIVIDTFKRIDVVIPSSVVADQFRNGIRPILDQIAVLTEEQMLIAQAHDRILPRLMSGKIDVGV